ncbi:hypothetical protein EDB80DRAFT_832507 [Ilyonectria destructans]|nr:hypothetical protein EDB80DRAFT_832507 [Ilyonectria destructans]
MAKITTRQPVDPNFSRRYDTEQYFQRLPSGALINTEDNIVVTRRGCDEFCGSHSFYWDAIPRLTTWVIPVVILLSNIELSPIDKCRFMAVVHAVGDPIDSFWSVLPKMYVVTTAAHRRYDSPHDRARIIATVLAGFEEISGAMIGSEIHYEMQRSLSHVAGASGPAEQHRRHLHQPPTPLSWLRGEFGAGLPRSSPDMDPLSPPSMARPRSDSRPLPGHVRQSSRGQRASLEIDPGDDYYRASGSTDTGTPLLTLSPLPSDSTKAPLLGPSMSARPQFQPPSWDATGSRTPGEPRATGQGDHLVQPQTERQAEAVAHDHDVVQLVPDTSCNAYFSWLQPLGAIYTYRP